MTGDNTYYLDDGDRPVVEEAYTGEDLFFSLFGATGLEGRNRAYAGAKGDPLQIAYSAYTYDPQGNLVQPVSLYPGRATGAMVRVDTSSAYDGFGWSSTAAAEGQVDAYSPVGFGGQYGYYRDYAGLYLLTHRYYYYDPGTGRFLTRDPIGYGGGMNLYGYADGNPVNESDPSGYGYEPFDEIADLAAVVFDAGKLGWDNYQGASASEIGIDRIALGLDALGLVPVVPPGMGRAYALAHGGMRAARAMRAARTIQTLRRAQAAAKVA